MGEAVLACLDGLKDAVDALPKDKLSMRQFSKLETNIEKEIANLQTLDKKIVVWLKSKGSSRNDSDFEEYKKESVVLLSAIGNAQGAYYELLSNAGLIPVPPKQEISGDLLGILQFLTATQKLLLKLKLPLIKP